MYLATWGDHFILEKIELDAFFLLRIVIPVTCEVLLKSHWD